jgi:hypothetical protein
LEGTGLRVYNPKIRICQVKFFKSETNRCAQPAFRRLVGRG